MRCALAHARTACVAVRLSAAVGAAACRIQGDPRGRGRVGGASGACACVCWCVLWGWWPRARHEATDGCGQGADTRRDAGWGRRWASQRDTPEQEARRRAKAAAAVAALGSDDSDAEQLEGPPVDMHGLFARIHAEEGLDDDGNALSDSGGEYDG